jgi:hypothetical protein
VYLTSAVAFQIGKIRVEQVEQWGKIESAGQIMGPEGFGL